MSCLFSHCHHVREQIREQFLRLQSGGERCAIDDRLAHFAQFLFEEAVPCNFSYQIERTEQRYPIFDQGSPRTRKLRVVTVSNDSPVSWNHQLETIPAGAPFVAANQCPETDNSPNPRQHATPPVPRNGMMNLQQNPRGQRKRSASLCHESA